MWAMVGVDELIQVDILCTWRLIYADPYDGLGFQTCAREMTKRAISAGRPDGPTRDKARTGSATAITVDKHTTPVML